MIIGNPIRKVQFLLCNCEILNVRNFLFAENKKIRDKDYCLSDYIIFFVNKYSNDRENKFFHFRELTICSKI